MDSDCSSKPEVLILHPARVRPALGAVCCLLLVAMLVWRIETDPDPNRAMLATGALWSGLYALYFGVSLIPGAMFLELNSEGINVCSPWWKSRYEWRHIAAFQMLEMKVNGTREKVVGFNWKESAGKASNRWLQRWANMIFKRSGFCDVQLPDLYRMKAEKLVILLEEWRIQHSPRVDT